MFVRAVRLTLPVHFRVDVSRGRDVV